MYNRKLSEINNHEVLRNAGRVPLQEERMQALSAKQQAMSNSQRKHISEDGRVLKIDGTSMMIRRK